MTEFTVRIAERTFAVRAMFENSRQYCEKYLWDGAADFSIEIAPADLIREREEYAREARREGRPAWPHPDTYLETVAIHRKISDILIGCDTLLFHGSVVAVDGAAYLFTAKSGTGKSTHTRLWRALLGERAVMVNDDKPFLRVEEDRVLAYGTPWNGKHRLDTNTAVPLKALCILERGAENSIVPIRPDQALTMLFQQSRRPEDVRLMPRYMDLIDGLARNTAFYRLSCNMEPEAAEVAYLAMSQGIQQL